MKLFLLGCFEFNQSITTGGFNDHDLEVYERGRDFMHKLTFRLFEI